MSFNDTLAYLVDLLAADTDIAALFPGKTVQVQRRFKRREEVNISDLPLFMVTRPRVGITPKNNVSAFTEHTVNLYCGFVCEDRAAAQEKIVDLEELLNRAVMKDPTLGGMVESILPGDSANDEGKMHPVYFLTKELHISAEISILTAM